MCFLLLWFTFTGGDSNKIKLRQGGAARDIAERPRGPSGVAAFMSAHSKTPYITPSMDFPLGTG